MTDFRDRPTSLRAGEELDVSKLESFLRSHFPGEAEHPSVSQFPSGHSNLTYCVELGRRRMVLRRPPFGSKVKSAHDTERELPAMSRLDFAVVRRSVHDHCSTRSVEH